MKHQALFSSKDKIKKVKMSSAAIFVKVRVTESVTRKRIHLKHQALFSSKDKIKKVKMSSAAIFVKVRVTESVTRKS